MQSATSSLHLSPSFKRARQKSSSIFRGYCKEGDYRPYWDSYSQISASSAPNTTYFHWQHFSRTAAKPKAPVIVRHRETWPVNNCMTACCKHSRAQMQSNISFKLYDSIRRLRSSYIMTTPKLGLILVTLCLFETSVHSTLIQNGHSVRFSIFTVPFPIVQLYHHQIVPRHIDHIHLCTSTEPRLILSPSQSLLMTFTMT